MSLKRGAIAIAFAAVIGSLAPACAGRSEGHRGTGNGVGAGMGGIGGAVGGGGGVAGTEPGGTGGSAGVCPCDSPACTDRIQNFCAGLDHCPPTLEDELDYARWPHEPNGFARATYRVCEDGSSSFSAVDPFGEAPYGFSFAADGSLIAVTNIYSTGTCGEPPAYDPNLACRTCNILRAGGLTHTGEDRDERGFYYCLLDEDDKLVMPPGIPTDAEIVCETLDVRSDGAVSDGAARYYWDGSFCMPLRSDGCAGNDCARLSPTGLDCDQSHHTCYAGSGIGLTCAVDADCALAVRGCCGPCGIVGVDDLMAIRAEDSQAYQDACSGAPCLDCLSTNDPSAYASCAGGWCSVSTR